MKFSVIKIEYCTKIFYCGTIIVDKKETKPIGKDEKNMMRYGHEETLKQELLDVIATYMDDDIRENIAFEFAPCSPDEFLAEYVKRDPNFANLLKTEFSIEL